MSDSKSDRDALIPLLYGDFWTEDETIFLV